MRVSLPLVLVATLLQPATFGTGSSVSTHRQDSRSDEDAPDDIKCGQILVRGCGQFTRPELCQLLDSASDNPFDPDGRGSVQGRLISAYIRRGFLDADVAWDDTGQRTNPSVPAVILTISEGPVYRVRRLDMIGNANTRDRIIRRRVPLDEGAPFDDELLELSIRRINQLGIFHEFTREDVGVKVNKKGHFVDLTFRLKEIE